LMQTARFGMGGSIWKWVEGCLEIAWRRGQSKGTTELGSRIYCRWQNINFNSRGNNIPHNNRQAQPSKPESWFGLWHKHKASRCSLGAGAQSGPVGHLSERGTEVS
jgi:hypothetical protein